MKPIVDPDICIGCEACVDTCPEVFQMEDDVAVPQMDEVPENLEESCRDAVDICPVDAICVEEE